MAQARESLLLKLLIVLGNSKRLWLSEFPCSHLLTEMTKEGSYVPPSHGEGDSSHGEYASQGIGEYI